MMRLVLFTSAVSSLRHFRARPVCRNVASAAKPPIFLSATEVAPNRAVAAPTDSVLRLLPAGALELLLVLDVEATCDSPQRLPHEIIEWPCVLVDAATASPIAEFHRYVRPTEGPTLSPFCKKLTGISQEQVDAAEPLDVVLRQFDDWLVEKGLLDRETHAPLGRWSMATDGPWDLNHFTARECVRKGIAQRPHLQQYLNVRKAFARFQRLHTSRGCSLAAQLAKLGLKFEGRPHSGIDDTRNIARVLCVMLRSRSLHALHVNEAADPNLVGGYISINHAATNGNGSGVLRGPKKARGKRAKALRAVAALPSTDKTLEQPQSSSEGASEPLPV